MEDPLVVAAVHQDVAEQELHPTTQYMFIIFILIGDGAALIMDGLLMGKTGGRMIIHRAEMTIALKVQIRCTLIGIHVY